MLLDLNTQNLLRVCENSYYVDALLTIPCISRTQVTMIGNVMWMYGGMVEIGDQEITLDDIWKLDVNKLDGWKCISQPTATEALWKYSRYACYPTEVVG